VLPAKSRDETDVGWGEPPEPDDEERLRRERPPHWGLWRGSGVTVIRFQQHLDRPGAA
jgi:hypothetical protein